MFRNVERFQKKNVVDLVDKFSELVHSKFLMCFRMFLTSNILNRFVEVFSAISVKIPDCRAFGPFETLLVVDNQAIYISVCSEKLSQTIFGMA